MHTKTRFFANAALASAITLGLVSQATAQQDWDAINEETLRHFRALLQFDTSDPPGRELPAAEYIRDVLEAEGFEVEMLANNDERPNVVTIAVRTTCKSICRRVSVFSWAVICHECIFYELAWPYEEASGIPSVSTPVVAIAIRIVIRPLCWIVWEQVRIIAKRVISKSIIVRIVPLARILWESIFAIEEVCYLACAVLERY